MVAEMSANAKFTGALENAIDLALDAAGHMDDDGMLEIRVCDSAPVTLVLSEVVDMPPTLLESDSSFQWNVNAKPWPQIETFEPRSLQVPSPEFFKDTVGVSVDDVAG